MIMAVIVTIIVPDFDLSAGLDCAQNSIFGIEVNPFVREKLC